MKGRLTHSQVNAVVVEINKAVASKYSIMRQPVKTMVNATRNLYFRFQEEETKDTKGERSREARASPCPGKGTPGSLASPGLMRTAGTRISMAEQGGEQVSCGLGL